MNDTKSFLLSKTLWGLVIAVVAQLAQRHGFMVDQDGLTNDALSLVGIGLTIYGRFAAAQGLHVVTTPPTQSGFARPWFLVALFLSCMLALSLYGCAGAPPKPNTTAQTIVYVEAAEASADTLVVSLFQSGAISRSQAETVLAASTELSEAVFAAKAMLALGNQSGAQAKLASASEALRVITEFLQAYQR